MPDAKKNTITLGRPVLPETEWAGYVKTALANEAMRHTLQKAFSILTFAATQERLDLFDRSLIQKALEVYVSPRSFPLAPLPQTAATYGSLYQIKSDLNARVLLFKHPKEAVGGRAQNAISLAAEHGNLDQIAPDLLTDELLFQQQLNERCPAFRATRFGYLYQLPSSIREDPGKLLIVQNRETIIELAIRFHQTEELPTQLTSAQYQAVREIVQRIRSENQLTKSQEEVEAATKGERWLRIAARNLISTTQCPSLDGRQRCA